MRAPCPMCGSSRHRKTFSEASFQVLASRRCRDCGHIWEPPAPRWLLKVGLVIGLAWVAFGAFLTLAGPIGGGGELEPRFLWMCGMGAMAIVGCWYRLRNEESRAESPDPGPPRRGLDA